jgi:predicted nucleic acid-binding Zn ribbon protein
MNEKEIHSLCRNCECLLSLLEKKKKNRNPIILVFFLVVVVIIVVVARLVRQLLFDLTVHQSILLSKQLSDSIISLRDKSKLKNKSKVP